MNRRPKSDASLLRDDVTVLNTVISRPAASSCIISKIDNNPRMLQQLDLERTLEGHRNSHARGRGIPSIQYCHGTIRKLGHGMVSTTGGIDDLDNVGRQNLR